MREPVDIATKRRERQLQDQRWQELRAAMAEEVLEYLPPLMPVPRLARLLHLSARTLRADIRALGLRTAEVEGETLVVSDANRGYLREKLLARMPLPGSAIPVRAARMLAIHGR